MKRSIASVFFILPAFFSKAQNEVASESTITSYLHIKTISEYSYKQSSIIGFILTNIDTLGMPNWKSGMIQEFEKEKEGQFFVKVNIPAHLYNNSKEIWCKAIKVEKNGNSYDTVSMEYGGVMLSKIKLILQSNPQGAETFLIPNRIWLKNYDKLPINKAVPQLEKYRVNTSNTNTYAFVDETVFVVLYKVNDKVRKLIHKTKPFKIEPEQTVWANFE